MNCKPYTYLLHHANGQMHMYLIASSDIIIIKSVCHVPIQVSQDGFMLRLIWVFLGYGLPIQLLLKLLSCEYDDRFEDRFHHIQIQIRTYKIYNILCLNK